ncbi:hypothetical protein [Nocardia sp. CA-120079]|uniref:hypothetical protein n=1 Tax=Nocardia sp. CA-120079 TaxID=3239974 RepID=UPI003D98D082
MEQPSGQSFGNWVRGRRTELGHAIGGMTIAQAAAKSVELDGRGVTDRTWGLLERDETRPSASTLAYVDFVLKWEPGSASKAFHDRIPPTPIVEPVVSEVEPVVSEDVKRFTTKDVQRIVRLEKAFDRAGITGGGARNHNIIDIDAQGGYTLSGEAMDALIAFLDSLPPES